MTAEKCVVIGAGPAGYTAAIYLARAGLNPLVLTGMTPGGQLTTTTEVENFPGFPEGVMGPELMNKMAAQAEKFGARISTETVTKVELAEKDKKIFTDKNTYTAKTVIIATGAQAMLLGVPGEKELMGRGVSACATCDGFFFKDKNIAVVGGGDSAMEEAIFLTKFASRVTVIHRRDSLRASKIMQDRAKANPKISFLWNKVVTEITGSEKLEKVKLKDTKTGEESELELDGIFIAVGHRPATEFLAGQIELDEKGYIKIQGNSSKTSVPGVFAAGDVHDSVYKQAVTAAGAGCKAALDAEKYLEENN